MSCSAVAAAAANDRAAVPAACVSVPCGRGIRTARVTKFADRLKVLECCTVLHLQLCLEACNVCILPASFLAEFAGVCCCAALRPRAHSPVQNIHTQAYTLVSPLLQVQAQ